MPFATLDSTTRFFYDIYGGVREEVDPSKPTVLLLSHPRFFDHELFAPQYTDAELRDNLNCVAIDLHYHGQTEVEMDDLPFDFTKALRIHHSTWRGTDAECQVSNDVFRLLDSLGITSCHVFGESLEALVAIRMAVVQSERVLSLTLCATPPPEETPDNLAQFRSMAELARHRDDTDDRDRLPNDMFVAGRWLYFGKWPAPDTDRWEAKSKFVPSNKALMAKIFSVVLDRKAFPVSEWQKITMPVLMIHGGADVQYPLDTAHQTYNSILQSTSKSFEVVDGAPHLFSWTHPELVNKLFADFMHNQAVA